MAHKKGTGSTRNGRDSNSKRLGVKAYVCKAGVRALQTSDPERFTEQHAGSVDDAGTPKKIGSNASSPIEPRAESR